jgi:DNA invertase Pin-like site-specific DNA recombinase
MIMGYARVSKEDSHLDMQIEAIEKYASDQGERVQILLKKKRRNAE